MREMTLDYGGGSSKDAEGAKVLLELADRVACDSLKSRRSRWALLLMASADYHSRYVVSCALDQTLELGFVLEAMQWALRIATPQICNSD